MDYSPKSTANRIKYGIDKRIKRIGLKVKYLWLLCGCEKQKPCNHLIYRTFTLSNCSPGKSTIYPHLLQQICGAYLTV
jgi:hypothetical protein